MQRAARQSRPAGDAQAHQANYIHIGPVLHLNIKIGFDRLDVGAADSIPALESTSWYSIVHGQHVLNTDRERDVFTLDSHDSSAL